MHAWSQITRISLKMGLVVSYGYHKLRLATKMRWVCVFRAHMAVWHGTRKTQIFFGSHAKAIYVSKFPKALMDWVPKPYARPEFQQGILRDTSKALQHFAVTLPTAWQVMRTPTSFTIFMTAWRACFFLRLASPVLDLMLIDTEKSLIIASP